MRQRPQIWAELARRSDQATARKTERLRAVLVGYVVIALVARANEAAGLITCECYPDCWCKKPGLSVFRWVFPRYHHLPARDASQKQQLDET